MNRHGTILSLVLLCAGALCAQQTPPAKKSPAPAKKSPSPQALRLSPKLTPGQVFRYQLEFRTVTENHHEGLVQDPQSASQLKISWDALVRVEVLAVKPEDSAPVANSEQGTPVRIRTTYERSTAKLESDSFDPAASLMQKQYQNLEGHAIEFTLQADGNVTDVSGLEDVAVDHQAADAARQWVNQLVMSASLPAEGIVPGQHWTAERAAQLAPLAGIVWRTDSTYLRDENCRPAALPGENPPPASGAPETCAVILTRLEMGQPKPLRDPTPDDYRKRGLRTSGTWHGTGESLCYISRRTGWVVSSTQSGSEEMNITIASVTNSSTVHYAGKVTSHSQLSLLPGDSSAPAPH